MINLGTSPGYVPSARGPPVVRAARKGCRFRLAEEPDALRAENRPRTVVRVERPVTGCRVTVDVVVHNEAAELPVLPLSGVSGLNVPLILDDIRIRMNVHT
jgi:hypothetical protein